MILEVSDSGELILPAELVQAAPHTRFEAGRQGEALILQSAQFPDRKPLPSLLDLPILSDRFIDPEAAFRREDLYDDDGR